jgi:hypothetical protein
MQNIDPVVFIEPVLAIVMSVVAIAYWRRQRGFRGMLFVLSLVAYSAAIAAKEVIQVFTLGAATKSFGSMSVGLGLYYGLQTVFLEVGLAYVLAVYGARRRGLKSSDGVGFGLSLAFWENGVLLGAFPLLNLGLVYLLIASGSGAGQAIYTSISAAQPAYFLPPFSLLPSALLGTLERLSSMLAHVAWGVLCVLAAVTGRRRYLGYALPMGMLDALVPFASLNVTLFEVVVFLLSLGFVLVAWWASRSTKQAPLSLEASAAKIKFTCRAPAPTGG